MRLRHKNSHNKHKTDTFRKDRTLPGMQIDTLSSTEISRLIKFPCWLFENVYDRKQQTVECNEALFLTE